MNKLKIEKLPIAEIEWLANQGHKEAQTALSHCLNLTTEQRGFWAYKANGGKAFTMEAEECQSR